MENKLNKRDNADAQADHQLFGEKSVTSYKTYPIDTHTWRIEDIFGDYMYLVEGTNQSALIDTGMGLSGLADVVRTLTNKPVIVLCTHGHVDHVGANGEFEKIYIHPEDEALLRQHGDSAYRQECLPAFMKEIGVQLPNQMIEDLIHVSQPEKLSYLFDGQRIDLGERTLEVIGIPGHTRGSVCFLDQANRQLFSGDMLCTMGIMLNFDCSTTVSQFLATMEKLKARVSGCVDEVYGGHHVAPITTDYIDKYIECGRSLLVSSEGAVAEQGVFGQFWRYFYDDISLTYTKATLK